MVYFNHQIAKWETNEQQQKLSGERKVIFIDINVSWGSKYSILDCVNVHVCIQQDTPESLQDKRLHPKQLIANQ